MVTFQDVFEIVIPVTVCKGTYSLMKVRQIERTSLVPVMI